MEFVLDEEEEEPEVLAPGTGEPVVVTPGEPVGTEEPLASTSALLLIENARM